MKLALTLGEPAGIGPDVVLLLAQHVACKDWVVLGDMDMLRARADLLGINFPFEPSQLVHIPLAQPCVPGELQVANADAVLACLDMAVDGCLTGEFDAMVTAPLHKSVIVDAGHAFSGHTEYLQARCRQ